MRNVLTDNDAIARATLLRMAARKWFAVRVADLFGRVLVKFAKPAAPAALEAPARIRILVIEYWQLGDIAILVPFLRGLRRAFPKAHVTLVVGEAFQGFLSGQGLVDEFVPVRAPWAQHFSRWKKYNPFSPLWISFARTFLKLRKQKFDVAFSGRMDFRDNFLLWATGASRRIGYGFAGGGCFLTDNLSADISHPHRADLWLRLLIPFGIVPGDVDGSFKIDGDSRRRAEDFLQSLNLDPGAIVIGVHPGARSPVRRWGDHNFAEVATSLLRDRRVTVLWFSEPGTATAPPPHNHCHSVALDFKEFVSILAHCHLLICNDSGPMHVSNLLRVPVVAVFGPQNPSWFGPRGPNDLVVIHPEMWCRPCFDSCIFDEPHCLRAITPEHMIASAKEVLRKIRFGTTAAVPDTPRVVVATGKGRRYD